MNFYKNIHISIFEVFMKVFVMRFCVAVCDRAKRHEIWKL